MSQQNDFAVGECTDSSQAVIIDYTNWRGVRARRRIKPVTIRFGSNEWHREPQWLLDAEDLTKPGEVRTFALAGVHSWKPL